MHDNTEDTKNEIDNIVNKFGVQDDLTDGFVKSSRIAHDTDQMDAFKYHLKC